MRWWMWLLLVALLFAFPVFGVVVGVPVGDVIYARKFVDLDDNTYYSDPSGISRLKTIKADFLGQNLNAMGNTIFALEAVQFNPFSSRPAGIGIGALWRRDDGRLIWVDGVTGDDVALAYFTDVNDLNAYILNYLQENYYTKSEADDRFVNETGDVMTGPLILERSGSGYYTEFTMRHPYSGSGFVWHYNHFADTLNLYGYDYSSTSETRELLWRIYSNGNLDLYKGSLILENGDIRVENGGNIYVYSGGKIGVGTTSPVEEIHVYDDDSYARIELEGNATAEASGIVMKQAGVDDLWLISSRTQSSGGGLWVSYNSPDFGWKDLIKIYPPKSDTPTPLLQVKDDSEVDGIVVGHEGGGRHLVINDVTGAKWALATGEWDLRFQKQNNDGTWSEMVRFHDDGSIQISQGVKLYNDSSTLKISNSNGYISIGTRNTDFAHFYTGNNRYYFNKPIYAVKGFAVYGTRRAVGYYGLQFALTGGDSDLYIAIQDGSGRANIYWNAYYDGSSHRYVTSDSVGASRIRLHGNTIEFYTAPAGTAGYSISWYKPLSLQGNKVVTDTYIGMKSDWAFIDTTESGIEYFRIIEPEDSSRIAYQIKDLGTSSPYYEHKLVGNVIITGSLSVSGSKSALYTDKEGKKELAYASESLDGSYFFVHRVVEVKEGENTFALPKEFLDAVVESTIWAQITPRGKKPFMCSYEVEKDKVKLYCNGSGKIDLVVYGRRWDTFEREGR